MRYAPAHETPGPTWACLDCSAPAIAAGLSARAIVDDRAAHDRWHAIAGTAGSPRCWDDLPGCDCGGVAPTFAEVTAIQRRARRAGQGHPRSGPPPAGERSAYGA